MVVSPGEISAFLRTVFVAPMTTGVRPAGFRVAVTFQGKQGLVVLDQTCTLDRARLVQRLGGLRANMLRQTLGVLSKMFSVGAAGFPGDGSACQAHRAVSSYVTHRLGDGFCDE